MTDDHMVYILSNVSRTLYIGMTSDPTRRLYQHREKLQNGFTRQYNITLLVYFEEFVLERKRSIENANSRNGAGIARSL